MRPRVQWALFCRDLTVDEDGLTTLSDLVHVLTVQTAAVQLWLVASIEGEPNETVPITLRVGVSGQAPVTLPTQPLTFGPHGFAELRSQLPPFPLSAAGTFSIDLGFADLRTAERVAVKIAASSVDPASI